MNVEGKKMSSIVKNLKAKWIKASSLEERTLS